MGEIKPEAQSLLIRFLGKCFYLKACSFDYSYICQMYKVYSKYIGIYSI